ncbi:hypothetical protein G9A89_013308 [Geosiphon pyriformis]|nr:hypothetical protein G9A89_013308 [Geosiphon pyriformis]
MAIPTFNDITKENLVSQQLVIKHVLSRAKFIALDTEFSGLGNPKADGFYLSNLEERYVNMCKSVRSHALLSFGITAFEEVRNATYEQEESGSAIDPQELNWTKTAKTATNEMEGPRKHSNLLETQLNVHNFEFTMFSQTEYVVTPDSLAFLLENGFDFNKQIRQGIPYFPGADKIEKGPDAQYNSIMRSIFNYILTLNVPIVLHNGFLDLLYIYYSFYAELPEDLNTLVCDLSEMFPGGIYDTRLIAEESKDNPKFLGYLFRKYEREQAERRLTGTKTFISMKHQNRLPILVSAKKRGREEEEEEESFNLVDERKFANGDEEPYCVDFATKGYCKKKMKCGKSHDLDLILDHHTGKLPLQKKRKIQGNSKSKNTHMRFPTPIINLANEPLKPVEIDLMDQKNQTTAICSLQATQIPLQIEHSQNVASHNAHIASTDVINGDSDARWPHMAFYDAYMTGYIFARHLIMNAPQDILTLHKNKVYIIGKNIPLLIEKSNFSKTSTGHQAKRNDACQKDRFFLMKPKL